MSNMIRISAITLRISNMKRSCDFYSQIPGFKLVYGGSVSDSFSTFRIGSIPHPVYLNLELINNADINLDNDNDRRFFGRIIFHVDDVDKLYLYFRNSREISKFISFEQPPRDAPWGERYFHIREPDGYELSFAKPIEKET
ncbi:MAG TPA: VOC family protein [Candidatus Nitrosocosmicus sp.]|nr:VOC family protein [Candidatus Nitrosocosmicus sp.]